MHGGDDQPLFQVEGVEGDLFFLLELVNELEECLVADDVDALFVWHIEPGEHEPQAASDGLLGKDVGCGCERAQPHGHCDVLNVPSFSEH
jgi:hypothetical protein